eukprot:Anaeramoba_ignava/a349057_106.p1 GENE.a349057_106~~a349057_106.p1  ORF type:complete len:414 (-),score=82.82 a349057_106:77-1258(-)
MKSINIIIIITTLIALKTVLADDPDIFRNVTELIKTKGYPVEVHKVITEDKFELELFRLPRKGGKPVILWHGVFQNAGTWTMNWPGEDLIYFLYNAGYDVYLGNTRATEYSKKNYAYDRDTQKKEYWNLVDFDYMAQFDLPAAFDYILGLTGFEKLTYIGHSQGCTIAFALFSQFPDYAKKVDLFFALAPAVFISHCQSPLAILVEELMRKFNLKNLLDLLGVYDFDASNPILQALFGETCKILPFVCENALFMLAGWDLSDLNQSRVDVYASHADGTSTRNFEHGMQCMETGVFKKYDYGSAAENQKHYNSNTPPTYDLSSFTEPKIVLYYGGNDILTDPYDIEHSLIPSLDPDVFDEPPISLAYYDHLDFIWAVDAHEKIYKHIVERMNQL